MSVCVNGDLGRFPASPQHPEHTASLGTHPEHAEGLWKHATGSKKSLLEKMSSYKGDPPVFSTFSKWLYSVQPHCLGLCRGMG